MSCLVLDRRNLVQEPPFIVIDETVVRMSVPHVLLTLLGL